MQDRCMENQKIMQRIENKYFKSSRSKNEGGVKFEAPQYTVHEQMEKSEDEMKQT